MIYRVIGFLTGWMMVDFVRGTQNPLTPYVYLILLTIIFVELLRKVGEL